MRALGDSDFLSLWESGSRGHPLDRALLALGAVLPEEAYASIAAWPLGRRNQALARLHCAQFGPRLRGMVACASCGEDLEVDFDARMLAEAEDPGAAQPDGAVEVDGERFRAPTTNDLARVARAGDPQIAAVQLLESCRLGADRPREWTAEQVEAIGEQLALADPLAEILVHLRCPECGAEHDTQLDVGAFVWAEVDDRVRRLLAEIHALASAYGWSESDILGMSRTRRSLYLGMIRS